jgi:pyruvate dehydrogenase E1 component alpha subunit
LAENPLLPHRKLQELHALILHCRALDRALRGKTKSPAREALLAASAIHLQPGDLIFAEADDSVAASLAPKSSARKSLRKPTQAVEFQLPRLAAAAAAAHSLKPSPKSKSKNFVLAHTHENALEPNWQATLRFAHDNKLPLLFLCAGAHPHPRQTAAQKANRNAFTWESVRRFCARLHLPLLPVDGEDAVALYRVFQESTLHARAGAAPAVIWAMFHPSTVALSRWQTPVARLQAYCRARGIKLK